jgi:VanZ family protein
MELALDDMTIIARVIGWFLLAAAVFLTLGPRRFRPYTGVEHHLEHFLAFVLLGLMFGFGYPAHRRVVALIAVIMIAILETFQLWVPGRHGNFADFAVNATGACVGLAGAAALQWIKRPRAS